MKLPISKMLIYSISLLFFCSCINTGKEERKTDPYRISYKQLNADTALRGIFYFKGYYLCLQENLKIAVFDSNFIRKPNIEDSVNIFPIASLYRDNDTVFLFKDDPYLLGYPKNEYYLASGFKIQTRPYLIEEPQWPANSRSLYDDLHYHIYANYIGSGGFLVFFYNKQSKNTYATWSWGPMQILKFNNSYYIAEEGNYKVSPAFRIIPDPSKLIVVPNEKVSGLIQLFQHLAPFPGDYYKKLADSIEKAMLPVYGSSQNKFCTPIYTFIKDTCLYSIVNSDSSIYLTLHKKDSLIKLQTIIDTSIEMDRFSYNSIGKDHFITFEASGGTTIDGRMQDYSNCGFILIKDSTIDFLYYYSRKPVDP